MGKKLYVLRKTCNFTIGLVMINMGLIREPKNVDFLVEPHEVTKEDHLAMLAFIAACKDRKAEQKREIDEMKQSFKQIIAVL